MIIMLNKKMLALSFAVIAFSILSIGFFIKPAQTIIYASTGLAVNDKVDISAYRPTNQILYTGIACLQVIRSDGTKEPEECKHNIITNRGLTFLKMSVNGSWGTTNLNTLALGNATAAQAATDTALGGLYTGTCNLSAAAATYAGLSPNGNSSLNYLFTTNCSTVYVNATGIYNATTSGNLFAETTFSTKTLNSGDQINETYYWWIV